MRNVVAPVISSPCRIACCTGAAPRQAGSSEKCRFTQPCARNVERRRRQQRAVGDDRRSSPARARAAGRGTPGRRAAAESAPATPAAAASSATGGCVAWRPRPAGAGGRVITATTSCREAEQGAQRRYRRRGRTGERQPHRPPAVARVRADLDRRDGQSGRGRPRCLADRLHGRLAGLGVSRRSTNSTPSRWSVSCCMQRASFAVPSTVIGSPYMFWPCATTCARRRQSKRQAGDRQAALRRRPARPRSGSAVPG